MNQKVFSLVSLLIFVVSYSQNSQQNSFFNDLKNNLNVSYESNSQWYLNDSKFGDFNDDDHLRTTNFLRLDYQLSNTLTTGLQLESYFPKNLLNNSPIYDKDFGLATAYIRYKKKDFDFTLGHYYVQFGSGLILRSWEDRALGINNALFGAKMTVVPTEWLNMTALVGKQRKGFDLSKGLLFGFDSEIDVANALNILPSGGLSVGLSYVGKKESYQNDSEASNSKIPSLVDSYAIGLNFSQNNFYTNLEYVYKGPDVRLNNVIPNVVSFSENQTFKGNAISWTLGYSQKGLGFSYNFRRLENMRMFSERAFGNANNNPTNQLSINYLPALSKQHDYTLSNIYLYQSQPGLFVANYESPLVKAGEIGQFVDLFYNFKKGTLIGGQYGTKINLNMSYWASLDYTVSDPNGIPYFASDDLTYTTEFLNFKNKLYTDLNVEIRKKWSPKLRSIFTYTKLFYNKSYLESKADNSHINAWIGVAESTYKFSKGKSVRLELQHLSTNDDARNWMGGTVEYFFNSKLGIYFNDSYNYEESKITQDTKIHYFNLGGSFTKGSTRVAVNYGRQRGGLLCVGGICRPVSQNTGVTLNIISTF